MSTRFGRYELLRPLGRGGMAEVFLARYLGPEGFEKRLVIKRILPRFSDDRRLLRMFFEEARTHVSLSHGNLVAVFDFGRVGNSYFIAMDYVEGVDLEQLVRAHADAGRRLSPQLAAFLAMEVCRGLAYVHRRGLVHRDLTPRNILLSVDGEAKLSDFGLVMPTHREGASAAIGTPAYMAPEQAAGDRVDGRADLCSLGLVLAELLTGERARHGLTPEDTLALARAGAPASVSGPLAAIVARATQPLPSDRFASAEEMLAALEREAARLGGTREALSRELAAKVTALAPRVREPTPPRAPSPAEAATAPADNQDGGVALTDAPEETRDRGPRGGTGPGAPPVETYFRGGRPATIVDEVLGEAPPPTRPARSRRNEALAVAGLVAALGGVLALAVTTKRAPRATASPAPAAAPSSPSTSRAEALPAATPPLAPAPSPLPLAPVAALPPAPPAPSSTGSRSVGAPPPAAGAPAHRPAREAAPPAPARRSAPTPAAAATAPPAAVGSSPGRVEVRCSPWCVPFVDDRPRGPDGRSHTIELPAGVHRVEARRLEDRQARTITVRGGESQTVLFQFE